MAAPNTFPGLRPNTLMQHGVRLPVFGTDSAFSMKRISRRPNPTRIAVIGNHLPRQCGIATFTTDLCNAIAAEYKTSELSVVAVNDPLSPYAYPSRVRFEITEGDASSYRAAANYLNLKDIDVVCLQHEYGIYGGEAGSHVLELLKHLRMPVVTTLHTVLCEPDVDQRNVLREIASRSERLVVMSEHSSRFLQDKFGVPESKIDLIPHGIPDLALATPKVARVAPVAKRKTVLLTFGLLSPNKGFENVIHALPSILSRHSDVVYIIAGATHPHVRLVEGDQYRFQLQALAKKLGVEKNVIFYNRFVNPQEMASLVTSADIYITPYRYEAQAVSGTLAFALGAGKAIISTPYWYATELLADGRGALVPFEDSGAIADATIGLLEDDTARAAMSSRAYLYARRMVWNRVAQSYMRTFVSARANCVQPDRVGFSVQTVESIDTRRLASA
ncbi:MAG: glycosyltransferase family 4 protein [Terracidiphilus sp.]|jgi:glycosyltransferase involved in cell wall biosynthesis